MDDSDQLLQDFSGDSGWERKIRTSDAFFEQRFCQNGKSLGNNWLGFFEWAGVFPELERSAVCFPYPGDTAEEGAGYGAGFLHGFCGDGALEVLGEGRHKEVQPAVEVGGVDGEVDVFGERMSGIAILTEQGHVPKIIHGVEVGLPVFYAGVEDRAQQVVSADFIVEFVDERFYVFEPCYI